MTTRASFGLTQTSPLDPARAGDLSSTTIHDPTSATSSRVTPEKRKTPGTSAAPMRASAEETPATIPWYRLTADQALHLANLEGRHRPSYGPSILLGDSPMQGPSAPDSHHETECLPPPIKRLSPFAAIFHPSVSLLVEAPALLDLQEILREQGRTLSASDSNVPFGTGIRNCDRDPPPPPAVPRKPKSTGPTPSVRKTPRHEKGRGRRAPIGLDPLRHQDNPELPLHWRRIRDTLWLDPPTPPWFLEYHQNYRFDSLNRFIRR